MRLRKVILILMVLLFLVGCALTQDDAAYNCWDYASQGVKCGYKK